MPAIIRDDLSDRLIHLTKGEPEQALSSLVSIIEQRKLIGGTGFIKGQHRCVCFSEAPISKIGFLLAHPRGEIKYKPYGVMFRKQWIYRKGGRPVFYQADHDYAKLPTELQHLHVRFDLSYSPPTDHTWEREWRLRLDELSFGPDDVSLILPNRDVLDSMVDQHQATGKPFPWRYILLEDLGVPVDHGIDANS